MEYRFPAISAVESRAENTCRPLYAWMRAGRKYKRKLLETNKSPSLYSNYSEKRDAVAVKILKV
ncbi:hypothetical protein M513_02832 [Trichuris suis]|uniref:Uncharacterized protein n=1 Tax=Trichuris suis TaxID=68888 RepID=A0A085MGN1_9BILA|nr:hypothetical protein M513_02832 [Trichuris suis]